MSTSNPRQCFTLINKNEVNIAPNSKIIKADEYQTLVNAQQLTQKTLDDAIAYKKKVIAECEQLKERAQIDGFEQGFEEFVKHISLLEKKVHQTEDRYIHLLAPLAIKAAKKIVNKEISVHEDTIVSIIAGHLKNVSQHEDITIYVSKEDLAIVERHKNKLRENLENIRSLAIRERDTLTKGSCAIESEVGIINAQIEDMWSILEGAFEKLMLDMSKKPPLEPPEAAQKEAIEELETPETEEATTEERSS